MTTHSGSISDRELEFVQFVGALKDPANWEKDERACGCVFWTFQHPITDEKPPWEILR